MSSVVTPTKDPVEKLVSAPERKRAPAPALAVTSKLRWRTLFAVPVATILALAVHFAVVRNDPEPDTTSYVMFLCAIFVLGISGAVVQLAVPVLRRKMAHICPIFAA